MSVQVCGCVFTHLLMQRTIWRALWLLLWGFPDDSTCDLTKQVEELLMSDVNILCL